LASGALAHDGNVSRGGVFVRSDSPLPVGEAVQLTLTLLDKRKLVLSGSVVHRVEAASNAEAGFGVQFNARHALELEVLGAIAASHTAGENTYELDATQLCLSARLRGTRLVKNVDVVPLLTHLRQANRERCIDIITEITGAQPKDEQKDVAQWLPPQAVIHCAIHEKKKKALAPARCKHILISVVSICS
jgi:hypothetical protein